MNLQQYEKIVVLLICTLNANLHVEMKQSYVISL